MNDMTTELQLSIDNWIDTYKKDLLLDIVEYIILKKLSMAQTERLLLWINIETSKIEIPF